MPLFKLVTGVDSMSLSVLEAEGDKSHAIAPQEGYDHVPKDWLLRLQRGPGNVLKEARQG